MTRAELTTRLLTRSRAASRRSALAGLTGWLFAASPLALAFDEAAARKNRQRKRRGKKRKSGQPPTSPPISPPPSGPVARPDATCPGPGVSALVFSPEKRLAQTFRAVASGPLVSAAVEIGKVPDSLGDYLLRLSPVDGVGFPTNDVLAEAEVANGSVPAGASTVTFPFSSPAAVVAGTRYALVLTRSGPDTFLWRSRDADDCLGRAFNSSDQSAPFETLVFFSFVFAVFVSS
jgi:hypothetical protein